MEFQKVKEKYLECKETLELIEAGDRKALRDTTVYQLEMMQKIVEAGKDVGLDLIARRTN